MSSLEIDLLVSPITRKRFVHVTLLTWIANIGLDFLLNAGVLARVIDWKQPGLLTPTQMFQRIPLGYLSFLLTTILMVWLIARMEVRELRAGLIFGMKFGALTGAAGFLGLLSILDLKAGTLGIWSAETVLTCTLQGAIIGYGVAKANLRRLVLTVLAFFAASILVAAILQNLRI